MCVCAGGQAPACLSAATLHACISARPQACSVCVCVSIWGACVHLGCVCMHSLSRTCCGFRLQFWAQFRVQCLFGARSFDMSMKDLREAKEQAHSGHCLWANLPLVGLGRHVVGLSLLLGWPRLKEIKQPREPRGGAPDRNGSTFDLLLL